MTVAETLTALDATFLELEEADESAHMHIGAVMIFESQGAGGGLAIEDLRRDVELRLDGLPRYRQRLSTPHTGGLSWPDWEEDPDFDLALHVRKAALPSPADDTALIEWASDYFSQRLDRRRPLWEMVAIDIADGRWALVSKTHHCMVDGVGSVDVAKALLDTEPEPDRSTQPQPQRERPASPPRREPHPADAAHRAAAGVRDVAGAAMGAMGKAVHVAGSALDAATHPHHLAELLRESEAMVELLIRDELVSAPRVSLNQPIGTRRRLAVAEIPLETLKQIRTGLGGTVNDAVLSAATGGFRRLLDSRGETPPKQGLRAMVPVNIRSDSERMALGNRISSLFVHLPVAEDSPLSRHSAQVEEAEGLKSGSQATGARSMVELAGRAPPVLHSFLARSLFATRLFNVTVTNVPGPQQPLYVLGSKLLVVWPLVPLAADHGVGLAVFSYDGSMFFCLNVDRDTVTDVDLLRDGIVEEIEALAALAASASAASPA